MTEYLYILGAIALVLLIRHAWRSYNHPVMVLTRQAVNMGWVASGTLTDEHGLRNTKLARDGLESIIWFRDQNVGLLKPATPRQFADFVELERWLATQSFDSVVGEEALYFAAVEAFLGGCGHFEDVVLPAQCCEDFFEVSVRVYRAGYTAKLSPKVVGALIVEAANQYNTNPELGLAYLQALEMRIGSTTASPPQ